MKLSSVFGTTSKEETEAARKGKALPFGADQCDIERDDHPTCLPKRGGKSGSRPAHRAASVIHVEAAKLLRERLTATGHNWFPEHYAQLVSRFRKAFRQKILMPSRRSWPGTSATTQHR
ncbi:hypothetical protein QIV92_24330 [Raoultella ornithinolytica]|nr:hypothetical protein [Raoultella ornithinolytica]